jgi:predicted phosphodiesterase
LINIGKVCVAVSLGDELNTPPADVRRKQALGQIVEMLERKGIDPADIGSVKRISLYQSLTKNSDGEAETHDLTAIQFSPAWESGPEWPVIQPGPAIKLPARRPRTNVDNPAWQTCVVLPDMQIGYFRTHMDTLEPTHDEQAISVALQIVKAVKPAMVVMVGDNIDAPEFGKYRLTPAFQRTMQAAIDRATTLCAEVRDAAPDAEIVWLAGNHEERIPNYLLDNASAAFGLRRGNTPESWPVLSIPYLCRMDEYRVDYRSGYPAGHVWINQRLRVIHGDKVASGGSTAHKYLATEKTSVIYGHIHRREWAERTREDWDGAKTVMAASPGCLARTDGVVPSTRQGTDLDGRPLRVTHDWQSGLAVVTYEPGDGRFVYEQVAIHDGWAQYRGKDFYGG